jgi:deoxyhypusine synthase
MSEKPADDDAQSALDAVLLKSVEMPAGSKTVRGYDFEGALDLHKMLDSMLTSGYQATEFGRAVDEVNRMLKWRLSDEPILLEDTAFARKDEDEDKDPKYRASVRTKIFLGFTSNLISSGVREQLRYLAKNKMVDVLVTTAGGVEEDFIKCLAPTFLGDFALKGKELRSQGLNRIGNLLVPNDNYCKFEDWMMPILDAMIKEQEEHGTKWTPSRVIKRLGLEINDEDSVYYWAAKNDIPVYCPALTDGSIGDMLYFHSFKSPGLIVDINEDVRLMNDEARLWQQPKKTGMLILGGGVPKHHVNNANLMRNGADFAVSVNTAQEFDGCDSGAKPDEAVSWGKIRMDATPVKVIADATIIFPLLVAQTFAKNWTPKD